MPPIYFITQPCGLAEYFRPQKLTGSSCLTTSWATGWQIMGIRQTSRYKLAGCLSMKKLVTRLVHVSYILMCTLHYCDTLSPEILQKVFSVLDINTRTRFLAPGSCWVHTIHRVREELLCDTIDWLFIYGDQVLFSLGSPHIHLDCVQVTWPCYFVDAGVLVFCSIILSYNGPGLKQEAGTLQSRYIMVEVLAITIKYCCF